MRHRSPVWLPARSAVPGGFVNDDSAVVFHVEPIGIGAACAATPQVCVVGGVYAEITIALHNGVSAGMPIGAGPPCPSVVGKVINIKIPVRCHVEQVLAVRRNKTLVGIQPLVHHQIAANATACRREGTGTWSCVSACLPFEYIEHQVAVILYVNGGGIGPKSSSGPDPSTGGILQHKVSVRQQRGKIIYLDWGGGIRLIHLHQPSQSVRASAALIAGFIGRLRAVSVDRDSRLNAISH